MRCWPSTTPSRLRALTTVVAVTFMVEQQPIMDRAESPQLLMQTVCHDRGQPMGYLEQVLEHKCASACIQQTQTHTQLRLGAPSVAESVQRKLTAPPLLIWLLWLPAQLLCCSVSSAALSDAAAAVRCRLGWLLAAAADQPFATNRTHMIVSVLICHSVTGQS